MGSRIASVRISIKPKKKRKENYSSAELLYLAGFRNLRYFLTLLNLLARNSLYKICRKALRYGDKSDKLRILFFARRGNFPMLPNFRLSRGPSNFLFFQNFRYAVAIIVPFVAVLIVLRFLTSVVSGNLIFHIVRHSFNRAALPDFSRIKEFVVVAA